MLGRVCNAFGKLFRNKVLHIYEGKSIIMIIKFLLS